MKTFVNPGFWAEFLVREEMKNWEVRLLEAERAARRLLVRKVG